MSDKTFIRLNINDNYLSLGNFFRVIKEESNNPSSFWQADLFGILFDEDSIADSTVNNYCTGLRAINPKYKKYFANLLLVYEKDNLYFVNMICKILELVYDREFKKADYNISMINNDEKLKHICERLYSISKNDSDVSNKLSYTLRKNIDQNNLYTFLILVLEYIIITKKQPIYLDNSINNIIEKSIYDTNISIKDIQDFINIQLNSGIWSIRRS